MPSPSEAPALHAADEAPVAVFAYRDGRGHPVAWPVTPYVCGRSVVVTSTLAFIRKAVHTRADGRIALLAKGVHMTGRAAVTADPSGEAFVGHLLSQELRKFPPARDIVGLPLSRTLFWWYYGRVIMSFRPLAPAVRPGSDAASLVWIDERGFPSILPIETPVPRQKAFTVRPRLEPSDLPRSPVPASVILHAQPTMRDLRQLLLRGVLANDRFEARSSSGSLREAPSAGALSELRRQLSYHRRALRARRTIRHWPAPTNGGCE